MHANLSPVEIDALVETTDPITGIQYPPLGLQPYHAWLIDTLHRLNAASVGQFLVAPADANQPTRVYVAPGHAILDNMPLDFTGQTVDLAPLNNQTARLALIDNTGNAEVQAALDWPASTHLKLAEVTLAQGQISAIADCRLRPLFTA